MSKHDFTRQEFADRLSRTRAAIEQAESLEQLRALANGSRIKVILTDDDSIGVDTPEQAAHVGHRDLAQPGEQERARIDAFVRHQEQGEQKSTAELGVARPEPALRPKALASPAGLTGFGFSEQRRGGCRAVTSTTSR